MSGGADTCPACGALPCDQTERVVKESLTAPTCNDFSQVDWRPIKSAPWQTVIEVRNEQMGHPCLATRGYVYNGAVHPNRDFCTTVFTPDPNGLFATPSGQLVCPTEWRPTPESAQ